MEERRRFPRGARGTYVSIIDCISRGGVQPPENRGIGPKPDVKTATGTSVPSRTWKPGQGHLSQADQVRNEPEFTQRRVDRSACPQTGLSLFFLPNHCMADAETGTGTSVPSRSQSQNEPEQLGRRVDRSACPRFSQVFEKSCARAPQGAAGTSARNRTPIKSCASHGKSGTGRSVHSPQTIAPL